MTNVFEPFSDAEQAELRKVYYAGAYEAVDNLQDALLRWEQEADDEVLRSAKRFVHTLKGDSYSVGQDAIGDLCHRMEELFPAVTENRNRGHQEATELLLSCADAVREQLRKTEAGTETNAAAGAMAAIDRFLRATGSDEQPAGGAGREDVQALRVRSSDRIVTVEAFVHPACAEKSIAIRMALQRLGNLGRALVAVPLPDDGAANTADRVTVTLATEHDPETIRRGTLITGIIGEVRVSGKQDADAREHAAPGTDVQAEFLRIEASRLDKLMNLAGELLIARSSADQALKELGGSFGSAEAIARLRAAHAILERTVSDLQKGIMKMRMVPVNQVFRKFPRMVRDLAAEKGKRAVLDISGKETELDKSIVDGLAEPLSHIIRNMIDHGIENPDGRQKAGKPETGRITLRAYHEAAQIVIEARDDGAGIDTRKLRRRAIEQGIVSADDAAKMGDAEAAELVFRPGLSTADTVSETSGRGVGMDAAKAAIEALRGSVELESTPGAGTLVRLRLPLTLAMIRSLLFRSGGRLFALPLSSVAEITRVTPAELMTVDGRDTLNLRDRTVSLVHIDRLFNREAQNPGKRFVLILNTGGRGTGLVVDSIVSQQELVVKSLNSETFRSDLTAGATLLGDGSVVVILDAAALIRKAIAEERKKIGNAA